MSQIKAKQLEGVHADQLLDNLISATTDPTASQDISQGYKPSSIWVNVNASPQKVFICSDNSLGAAVWIELKESSGASLTVTQALHGFSLCEVLKFNGTSYVRAQADVQANVGIWLITKIIDVNTFVISTNGYFTGLTGGTADTTGYLSSTTPGGLVTTAPAISQPIIYWTSATTGWVLGYPSSQAAVAPSSTPLGYNDIRVSFIGANLAYEGLTNNGGGISLSGAIAISGVAGWRYLVTDTLAVASVETIPPAEIIVDTQQYTPAPVFNVANNGYYSSVNPTKRIIAIAFFDGTNIIIARSYGNGSKKNDDVWESFDAGNTSITLGDRLQYTSSWNKTWGTNIIGVDNGAGNTDSEGFRITVNKSGKIKISMNIRVYGEAGVSIYKKGVEIFRQVVSSLIGNILEYFEDFCEEDDYYTFVITHTATVTSIEIVNPRIIFEEN
ncbi:MAG TPA: hypothetical protein PK079_22620 [Leptospiraceae bacterium]|nr:hypothetical protein [Leptospiraceae bacterium]